MGCLPTLVPKLVPNYLALLVVDVSSLVEGCWVESGLIEMSLNLNRRIFGLQRDRAGMDGHFRTVVSKLSVGCKQILVRIHKLEVMLVEDSSF